MFLNQDQILNLKIIELWRTAHSLTVPSGSN